MKRVLSLFLSAVMLACCLLPHCASALAAEYKAVEGTYNYDFANEVLKLVNEERDKAGLKPVVMTKQLTEAAMIRAAECVVDFSHTRPNGEECFTAFEWHYAAGENVACGQATPERAMYCWMNSEGHRANILTKEFTLIGIGCFEYNSRFYWTQCFSGGEDEAYDKTGTKDVVVDVSLTEGVQSKLQGSSDEGSSDSSDGSSNTAAVSKPPKTSITSIKAKSKGFTVKWKKKTKGVKGYQIQYSTSKSFKKKYTAKKTITNKKTTSKTIKKLKAKKKYYVRIRTYKVVGGKKYYSKWSKAVTVKTKK